MFDRKSYNRKYYEEHKEQIKEDQKRYYQENLEACRERQSIYEKEHRKEANVRHKAHYWAHREEVLSRQRIYGEQNKEKKNAYHKIRHEKQLKEVYEHYGNRCRCCGETRREFLSIEHKNGGGREHRRKIGGDICNWLIKNNFPNDFELLCMNCNFAKGKFGYCPHDREHILQ